MFTPTSTGKEETALLRSFALKNYHDVDLKKYRTLFEMISTNKHRLKAL